MSDNNGRKVMGHYAFGRNGGHTGGHLREPFCEWVETGEIPEGAEHRGQPLTPEWLTGLLWNCSDVMPGYVCDVLGLPPGSTYATGARTARQTIKEGSTA